MDLRVGPVHWPFTLEKRYIDVLSADGTVLLVYLGWLRVAGLRFRRVTAELFRPGEPPRRGAAAASPPRGGEDWLDYGAARIQGEELSFVTAGLSGQFRFRARRPPASPRVPLFRLGKHCMHWTVEVPDADADGELHWPGGSLRLAGRGYRDLVWMDLSPWQPVLRELRWGRIAAAEHASTWVSLKTAREEVSTGWLDGRITHAEESQGSLAEGRVLIEGSVADLEGLRLGVFRPLLRRLTRDPHEVKWACPADLSGARGVAIHEHVKWR